MTPQLTQELELDLNPRLEVRLLSGKFCCKSRSGCGLCVGLGCAFSPPGDQGLPGGQRVKWDLDLLDP